MTNSYRNSIILIIGRFRTQYYCSYESTAVRTFPLDDAGKSAATSAAVSYGGFDYMPKSGGLASRGDSRVWACVSHIDCNSKNKIVATDGGYELFRSIDEHSEVRAELPTSFLGISAEFCPTIDEFVGQGMRPNRIHAELTLLCGADEAKKCRIPTKKKIAARRAALTSSPAFQFQTFADLKIWAESKLINTREKFEAVEDLDELLIFSIFYENIEIPDTSVGAAIGAMAQTATFGFIYGSKRTMNQLKNVSLEVRITNVFF